MTAREPKRLPSVSKLRELLEYDPIWGTLTWRASGELAGWPHTDQKGRTSKKIWINQQEFYAHRVIWKLYTSDEPPAQIDHVNGVAVDNAWLNLSDGGGGRNRLNCASSGHNKTSGFTGVSWCSTKRKWRVLFTLKGITKHVGFFHELNLDEAIMAAMEARIEAGFSPRHGTGCFLARHHQEVVGYE